MHVQSAIDLFAKQLNNDLNVHKITKKPISTAALVYRRATWSHCILWADIFVLNPSQNAHTKVSNSFELCSSPTV